MNIIIDGKRVVVKDDFSIEYNEENPLFTESEAYTLSISFPLAGCAQNLSVFGHLHRKDLDSRKSIFSCLIDFGVFEKIGVLTIIEITPEEVKGQFLGGVTVLNLTQAFSPINDFYVDEMNISPVSEYIVAPEVSFPDYSSNGAIAVRYPYRNSNEETIHNSITGSNWSDDEVTTFPFLLPLTKKILEHLGYSVSFTQWESSRGFANIIACNAFVGQSFYSESLPHWTIKEYLEKLGAFMFGYFIIDDINKTVSYQRYDNINNSFYHIEHPLSPFKIESTDDCKYFRTSSLKYSDDDTENWKFETCDKLLRNIGEGVDKLVFDTYQDLLSHCQQRNYLFVDNIETPDSQMGALFYVKDIDTYFCIKCESAGTPSYSRKYFHLRPIGRFIPVNEGESSDLEIEILPARVPCKYDGAYLEVVPRTKKEGFIYEKITSINNLYEPTIAANIINERIEETKEYYEALYVADARNMNNPLCRMPLIDYFSIYDGRTDNAQYGTILGDVNYRLSRILDVLPNIDYMSKYSIDFISDDMPDVKSIFHIQGKRYLCEKITVDITPNGVSQLKKGIFYKIID